MTPFVVYVLTLLWGRASLRDRVAPKWKAVSRWSSHFFLQQTPLFDQNNGSFNWIKKNESEVLAYAKEYFFNAKQNDNYPIDPVQRFHLSNGAILENIHLNADLSENGIKNSLGLMVNYKYELDSIEKNHEKYFSKMSIPASKKLK